MKCEICGKEYQHLGSHIWHAHRISAKEYKMEFRLDLNFALISPEIKLKKQEAFEENREKYLKNLEKGKKYQFKKGKKHRCYYSKQSIDRIIKQAIKMNSQKSQTCPICKVKTKKLYSHLFNAHGLLVIKKELFKKTMKGGEKR